ncbi:MAG: YihA family ribosome biogenesis GTP-binding protein [Chitinophagia bacterium]|jgi:GTP-binding protein|nr:YihA family ribosome biogenesis GTP-binding protein [Chitinophagia bacterium]NCA29708.1 YihA family ribosome biogenesis GTP-binding protein [Chitinophagia bacterium]NDD15383.1 YihA family ribosome biogenesis GTP-binding protein [Chitinophagia bacterium]
MKIVKATYLISSPSFDQCPTLKAPEYAFIGRSNVGKSSIINALCLQKNLAKTSGTPGKTQLINHFEITSISVTKGKQDKWYIVDLPGYGFAKVAQSSRRRWEQMIENYLRKRENLNRVFVLIDSRHAPQKIDLEFMEQLFKWEIPFTIIFTKSDKEKPGVVARNVKSFFEALNKILPFLPQGFVTSAEKRTGVEEVLACIDQYNKLDAEGL